MVFFYKEKTFLNLVGMSNMLVMDVRIEHLMLYYSVFSTIRKLKFVTKYMYICITTKVKGNFEIIYQHLVETYGCEYHASLGPGEYLHKLCVHQDSDTIKQNVNQRKHLIGDPNLYKSNTKITVNGLPPTHDMPLVNIFESCFNIIDKPREYTELENYQGPLAKAWGLRDEQIEPDSQALSQFYGKYASKRCFIIGNGPSLNQHDLKLLSNEYTFGVNSLFYKSNETGFMPTFYVVRTVLF